VFDGLVVAIDGPAGSGKSSVARLVAEGVGLRHVDTGALYRAAALACLRRRSRSTIPACAEAVSRARIERRGDRTFLDGVDVEEEIRGTRSPPPCRRSPPTRRSVSSCCYTQRASWRRAAG
jgi:cytidylate kinase